jgi:flagellar motor switch protein FliM
MSNELLSQEEVENLLSAIDSAPAPAQGLKTPPPRGTSRNRDKVSTYDFKRPERVGKDMMRSLQTLHEGFGRNFAAKLSALLRRMVEVKLTSVDQLTYSEFVFSLENPSCFNLLRAAPLEGNLVLDINPSILYPIIDRLLGGGTERGTVVRRPLTEIELRLVSRITSLFLEEMKLAWENVVELQLDVERVESNPHLAQIAPPNEVVILISFELSFQDVRGMINLCIPYNAIERLGNKLSATSWVSYGKTQSNPDSRRMIERNLSGSLVEVVVQLAKTRITTKELIGLRIGDIITTEHDVKQPLLVEIESIPKFTARPGALKSHKAIQIEEQIVPDKPGDPSRV